MQNNMYSNPGNLKSRQLSKQLINLVNNSKESSFLSASHHQKKCLDLKSKIWNIQPITYRPVHDTATSYYPTWKIVWKKAVHVLAWAVITRLPYVVIFPIILNSSGT